MKKIVLHYYSCIEDYLCFTFDDNIKLFLFIDRNLENAIKSLDLNDAKVKGIFLSLFVKNYKLKFAISLEENENGVWPKDANQRVLASYFSKMVGYIENLYNNGWSYLNFSTEELIPIIEKSKEIYKLLNENKMRALDKKPSIVSSITWRIGVR